MNLHSKLAWLMIARAVMPALGGAVLAQDTRALGRAQQDSRWLAPCGLPRWFFHGGIVGAAPAKYVRQVGRAYGRPVFVGRRWPSVLARPSLARRSVWALTLAVRLHYAPMRSLCHAGLMGRLNDYCRLTLYSPINPSQRGLRSEAARVLSQLVAIRKSYLKRPPSVRSIGAMKQHLREVVYGGRRPGAGMPLEALKLEYPTLAAINWRIGTFRRWPLWTALTWQNGMFTMQLVAAARHIAERAGLAMHGVAAGLSWPVLTKNRPPTRVDLAQESRCLRAASGLIRRQALLDLESGKITLRSRELEKRVLERLRGRKGDGSK